ncbi:LAFE_0F04016g1_1 [Lachancea fermentati]|uniref:LAFE_0F04016g1_1 n=1 Tax=Lachancea fermentati TaxID=4955 RepID=A0A1G4MF08_LACFM|nr:LAFE_0F04016g1_1 [Lachancea fermentati]
MSFDDYASFMAQEIDRIADDSSLEDVIGEALPPAVAQRVAQGLQNEVDLRCREIFNTRNQDIVLAKIKDAESTKRLEELKTIIELVGDFPRERIGEDLVDMGTEEAPKYFSLQNIMADLEKLPRVSLVDSDDGDDAALMREYDELRQSLAEKAQVIRLGKIKLRNWQSQLDKLELLVSAVRETHGNDAEAYFRDYRERVLKEAKESAMLIEEVLKKNTQLSPDKRDLLLELAKQFNFA